MTSTAASASAQSSAPRSGATWELYSDRQRTVFLLVLFLISTSNYVDRNIIGVLLEPIKAEFGVSDTMLGLLSGLSFAIFYATLGLPIASWADRGDRRLIITISIGVWSLMTALCGLAQNFWQLALVRVGVGAGEAGAIPPAQSLLAEYFATERRAKALGIFMMSGTAGAVIALAAGGWIAQNLGWRAAFIIVGLPGLVLAIAAGVVLKEPRRLPGLARAQERPESMLAAIRTLLAKPAYLNILAAMVLYFLVAYGALVFSISLMIRAHGLSVAQAGGLFGLVSAVSAIVGSIAGGAIADRLAARDIRWLARLPAWGLVAALPFYELAFMAPNAPAMAAAFLLGGVLLTGAVPPMFAALHIVCGSRRRAMAVAVAFFFANLLGLGLGPLIAGSLSDALARGFGATEGLRYSMMTVMLFFLPTSLFMLRAAKRMVKDAED